MNISEQPGRALIVALAAIYTCAAGSVAADQGAHAQVDNAPVALAEDGTPYPWVDDAVRRDAWPAKKVHPSVARQVRANEDVRVLIYLYDTDTSRASRISDIKTAFAAELNAMSEEIRTIERKYRPVQSLPPAEEAMVVREMFDSVSDADKARLKTLREDIDRKLDAMRRAVDAQLPARAGGLGPDVLRLLQTAGAKVHAEVRLMNAISATVTAPLLTQLAALDSVAAVLPDPDQQLELDVSAPSVGFDTWWNGSPGYDGGPYDVAVIDTGVRQDHPNLTPGSWVTNTGTDTDSHGHGTHVAGIIASEHATHRGGAFGVDALIWAYSGEQSTTMNNMHWAGVEAGQTAEVVNHSIGFGRATDEDYTDNDSFYDTYIRLYDIAVAKSAGNEGWSDTAPRITHPATAYNLMAVANINDRGTEDRTDDGISPSSSVGPTLNGRRKPDIAAPGTNIVSTNNTWTGTPNDDPDPNCWEEISRTGHDFQRCSGTSMAAPHVAAASLLLNDAGIFNPMVQKAILINTADTWTSNGTPETTDDGPVVGSLWDKAYGWGSLDMDESHFNRTDYFVDSLVPRNDTNTPDDYRLYKGIMYAGEKATLVWQKRAGVYVHGEPALTRYALSDLNLRLYDDDTGQNIDRDLDGDDNVHQVSVEDETDVVIKVYAWSPSFEGATAEAYALATEENFVQVDPPELAHNYAGPQWVGPHQTFDVSVQLFNNGGAGAHLNTAELSEAPSLIMEGGSSRSVGTIAPGGMRNATFTLRTNNMPAGTHWVPVSLVSRSFGENFLYDSNFGVRLDVERTPPVGTCTAAPATINAASGSRIVLDFTASDSQTGVDRSHLYADTPASAGFGFTDLTRSGTSGSFSFTAGPEDGRYHFAVRTVDNGRNWESVPSRSECTTFVDRVLPVSDLTGPALSVAGTIPLSFAASDPTPSSGFASVQLWYREDSSSVWRTSGSPSPVQTGIYNFTPPSDGVYHFATRARDDAGNLEAAPSSGSTGDVTTVRDTQPPSGIVAINDEAPTTTSPVVTLKFSATDETSGVELLRVSNDGVQWSNYMPYAALLPDFDLRTLGGNDRLGTKTVYVQFRDAAGFLSNVATDSIELVAGVDTDGDGVADSADNCTLVRNADQRDSNGDGYGNVCDADLNNDGIINVIDLGLLRSAFFGSDADADFNGDGVVNVVDLGILRAAFFSAPGPSGVAP